MAADVSLSVDPLDSAVSKDSEPEATKEILSPSSDSPHPQSPPTVVADTLDVAPSLDPAQSPKGEMVTGSNVEMEPNRRRRGLSPASLRELIKPKPGSYYCVAKQGKLQYTTNEIGHN